MTIRNCVPNTDWFGIFTGFLLFSAGTILTATLIGAIIGIPMVLGSLELLTEPTTLRGTPCAD
jgi:hypothetical protein